MTKSQAQQMLCLQFKEGELIEQKNYYSDFTYYLPYSSVLCIYPELCPCMDGY